MASGFKSVGHNDFDKSDILNKYRFCLVRAIFLPVAAH